MPSVWRERMALSPASRVGSQARPYKMNVPTMSWTYLICASVRGVVLSVGVDCCTLAPYMMGADG